jgi:hypothetical protein
LLDHRAALVIQEAIVAIDTAPAVSEIDIRWELANYGRPLRYTDSEAIFLSITKRHDRISDALEEIAAKLVQDGIQDEERMGLDDSFDTVIGEAWEAIEKLLKGWATRAPERRARHRAQLIAEARAKAGTAA